MPESTLSPLSGTMNLATVLLRIKKFDKFTILKNSYCFVGFGAPKRSIIVQNDYNAGFYSIKVVFSPFGLLQV
jgi:hypothetical protein